MEETILVLAPHTDDCELSMGATMAHLIDSGYTIKYICFSTCEESVPPGFEKTVLRDECIRSNEVLGLKSADIHFFDFRVRKFSERRQDILELLVRLRKEFNPVRVYAPSSSDVHQDHSVIHNEAKRAFKNTSLLCYNLPWNDFSTSYNLIKTVSEENVKLKVRALSEYESQRGRSYFSKDFMSSYMKVNGVLHGHDYVELFEVIRLYD